MDREDGGWTLVAVYGSNVRPTSFLPGADYPRPGATTYGELSSRILDGDKNDSAAQFSIAAASLWDSSTEKSILAYVGGTTDDYVIAALGSDLCNYFDITTTCAESTYGPFTVYDSSDTAITTNGYACTTAHGPESDPFDEFGLNLFDGTDTHATYSCHSNSASTVGHYDSGRIFTSFQSSDPDEQHRWTHGVDDYWSATGDTIHQPGALFIR